MLIVGQKNANHVDTGRRIAVAKPRFDQISADVAVHAVVGATGDIAVVACRVDFQVKVAASGLATALPRWPQCVVARHDNPNRTFRIVPQNDFRSVLRPEDLKGGLLLRPGVSAGDDHGKRDAGRSD